LTIGVAVTPPTLPVFLFASLLLDVFWVCVGVLGVERVRARRVLGVKQKKCTRTRKTTRTDVGDGDAAARDVARRQLAGGGELLQRRELGRDLGQALGLDLLVVVYVCFFCVLFFRGGDEFSKQGRPQQEPKTQETPHTSHITQEKTLNSRPA
jgi:hypothetical protein